MKEPAKVPISVPAPPTMIKAGMNRDIGFYVHRHLVFGWWALLVFLSLGILLEVFHGFKIGWYLDVSNETRRLMWTLGHAHGTLLALINLAFAATLGMLQNLSARLRSVVSGGFLAATLLIPGGFILGGFGIHSGDPGLGILLVPLGAVFLLSSVFLVGRSALSRPIPKEPVPKRKA